MPATRWPGAGGVHTIIAADVGLRPRSFGVFLISSGLMLLYALVAAVLLRLLLPRMKQSGNPFVRELARDYGVRPTGPDGCWTRGDRLRAALWCVIGAGALVGIGLVAFPLAEQRAGTTTHTVLMGVGFGAFIFALMCSAMFLVHLVRAPFAVPLHEEPSWAPKRCAACELDAHH